MAKKKKKATPATKKAAPALLSDKNYISSGRARSLPIYKCLINEGWADEGMAETFILRKHVNGNVTVGVYLVDTFCTGAKNTFYLFNVPEHEFESRTTGMPLKMEECTYGLAHNIIYGAVAYAREYGIEPHPDFILTQKILEEDTEDIELIEMEFGRDGKPALLISPAGDPRADYFLRQLERYAGQGNYDVVDGRLEDSLEDDFDDYYMYPEEWEAEDWEDFIAETKPEELVNYPQIADYIYNKVRAEPTQAVKLLTTPTELHGFRIEYDALTDLPYNNTPEEIEELDTITSLLQQDDLEDDELAELASKLQRGAVRWPQNPIFYNRLVMVYQMLGEKEKADKNALLLYQKFPDYLFAKVSYTELLIGQGRLEEVPAVFGGNFSLAALYPQRNSFHIAEVVAFHTVLCHYYLEKGDLLSANIHQNILLAIDIPEEMPLNHAVLIRLSIAIAREMEEVLQEAQQSEEKKQELIAQLVN